MRRFHSLKYYLLASSAAIVACAEPATAPASGIQKVEAKSADAIVAMDTYDVFPYAAINPCNGEEVTGTARYRFVISRVFTPSGNAMKRVDLTAHFTGIGQITGALYNGTEQSGFHGTFGDQRAYVLSGETEVRIVSQGNVPNYFTTLQTHVTFNANETPTAETFILKTSCK